MVFMIGVVGFLLRLKRAPLPPSGFQKEKNSGRWPNDRGRLRNYLGRGAGDRCLGCLCFRDMDAVGAGGGAGRLWTPRLW